MSDPVDPDPGPSEPDRASDTTSAEASYGLSPMQKGMLFHQLFEPDSGADIEQMVMRFAEVVDRGAMERAWSAVAARHEVLRTSFLTDTGDEPRQQVHPTAPMEIVEIDQAAYDDAQAELRLADFLARDRRRGFDPALAPLSRVLIFRRGDRGDVVVWSFHHLLLDGRSFPIVLADVFAAYDAIVDGRPVSLPAAIPYRRFIDGLQAKDMRATRDFWTKTLAGFPAPTPLVVDGIGGVDESTVGFGEVRTVLEAEPTTALEALAAANDLTLNTMLQGAWARLLSIYSGEPDVVFGATRSGRYGIVDGADTMAGLFINTVPMRIAVPPDAGVADWLREIRSQHLAIRDHEHLPLVDIQGLSDVRSGTRLFDSILVYESYQLDPMMRERTGTGDRVRYELLEQTNHPLLLSVYGGDRLDLRLEYDRSMFEPSVAERMAGHVTSLLRAMASGIDGKVGELSCLDGPEASLVTGPWRTRTEPSAHTDLVSRWRQRVADSGADASVVASGREISYAELDATSEDLAERLAGRGVGEGQVVAIVADRSLETLTAILAVLKSGAAYLPLDPGYPAERLRHMVTDSGVTIVLTDGHGNAELLDAVSDADIEIMAIGRAGDGEARAPLPASIAPDSPAYLIYTSGSTGRPKGVLVGHDAVVNHADGIIGRYGLTDQDRVLQFAALSFDVAAEELFPTWLAGGTVVLRPEVLATSFEELDRFADDQEITVVNFPAAYWSAWVDHLIETGAGLPGSVRVVVVGSEKVAAADHRRWQGVAPPALRWYNAYGPTEATITATVFDPGGADPVAGPVMPIGRPLPNVSCLVVDQQGRPVPIGVPGELLIGGRGVALGYHDRPELTDERFVPDPFGSGVGARCYRSGDLVRWLPDGNLEFLGRIDDQVKIRGFRIELGEIEAALRDLDGIDQAAVVARPDRAGVDQLVAHVVASGGVGPDPATLRRDLERRLPAYMVPVAIAMIDSLPLTPSGKIDRGALPEIETLVEDRTVVAPRTELERRLAELWAEVLGGTEFGIEDDFFDAGGNSLSAIRLFSGIRSLTGQRVELPELFASPNIADLAALLSERGADGATSTDSDQVPSASAGPQLPSWVVPVKATGSRPPLFHLGGASVLRTLARHLPEDQPLYAVLEQDLGADHFATSVDEIIPHCVDGVRAVQPEGPYLIAGLCFGGIVALEMSRRLRDAGDDVALTVMIDSFAPGAVAMAQDGQPAPVDAPDEHSGGPRGHKRLTPRRIILKAKERLWRTAWGPLHELSRRTGRPMPDWLRDVEEANTIASDGYEAHPYAGDVTLFRATENSDKLDAGPANGWDGQIDGALHIQDVTGGHVSMYQEPYVIGLAEALATRIDTVLDKGVRERG